MQLTRTETLEGMLSEYASFADLIDTISTDDWTRTTRCDGWEVRDVAGHVVGTVQDVVAGTSGSRTPDQEAADLRDRSPGDLAAEFRTTLEGLRAMAEALDNDDAWASPSGVGDLTIGRGVLTLWFDTFVHADDIRSSLDLPRDTGAGLRASIAYLEDELTTFGWGPAAVVFTDQDEGFGALAIGDVVPASPTHKVPAHDFALAVTGRLDPAEVGLDPGVNIYAA
jgi:uncharacterized protein (TIGR03083 family)